MNFPDWLKTLWWAILTIGLMLFLGAVRFDDIAAGRGVAIDAIAIVLLAALLLAPLFGEVSLLGIVTLKQQVEDLKADVASIKMEVRQYFQSNWSQQLNVYPSPPPDPQLPDIEERIRSQLDQMLSARGISPSLSPGVVPEVPADVIFLFSLRRSIEQEVRRLALREGIDVQRPTVGWILSQLADRDIVPRAIVISVKDVYRVCSPAVHGDLVTDAQIEFAKDVGPRMLSVLKAL